MGDVDKVIGDDTQADPALHSSGSFVATAVQPVTALQQADAAFAAGAPLLRIAEPALLLQDPALGALGAKVRDRDTLDTSLVRIGVVASREEDGICSDQPRGMTELLLMHLQRRNQQVGVAGPLVVDLVVSDDLLLRLLDLDHLAELGRLAGLAFADDLRVGLEQADDLAWGVGIAVVDALSCLSQNLLHAKNHRFEISAMAFDDLLITSAKAALDADGDLAHEALGLTNDTARDGHQSTVALPHALLALLAAAARGPTNLHETAACTAGAVTQFGAGAARQVGDAPHRARQHPNPVAEQRRVGGVVDIGLIDGRVDPHPAPVDDPLLLGDRHDPLMDLLDDRGSQRQAELAQRLGVGHLGRTDARELAVHQVRSHFALEHGVAPVAHVLEHQEANHDIDRCALATPRAAVRPTARQGLVGQLQQHRILQHGIDVAHPVFPEIAHFLGNEAVAEIELAAAELDHLRPSRSPWSAWPWPLACDRPAP